MIDLIAFKVVLELLVAGDRHTAATARRESLIIHFAEVLALSDLDESSLVALLRIELVESSPYVFVVELVCRIVVHQLG